MTIDKLALYNDAVLLLGERKLSSLVEARESRYQLDSAWDMGAVDYCLEIIKPSSQRLTAKLNSPSVSAVHGLDSVHTLPSDYIATVGVYLDDKLDQPISRYMIDGATLICEFDTVYLRYVSNSYAASTYNLSFAKVISSYLAREIAGKIAPEQFTRVDGLFKEYASSALSIESEKETQQRSRAASGTLSADWIKIYNDALTIMGLGAAKITSGTNDSLARSIMDSSVDAGLVHDLLEDIGWFWAQATTKSSYNTSVEPDWGYSRAHDLPSDMHRLEGVFVDEYMLEPLKYYHQEDNVIYCDSDDIYLTYVSNTYLTTPSQWMPKFKRLVAAKLAVDAAPSIPAADVNHALRVYAERESSTKSADIQQSPPRMLSGGNWVGARFRGLNTRRRP